MDAKTLLDLAKQHTGARNDRELAKLLRISHAVPSHWRSGRSTPTPEHAARLAELAQIDAAPLVLEVLLKTTKEDALRRVLRRLKRSIAATLTIATLPAYELLEKCILCQIRKMFRSPPQGENHAGPPTHPGDLGRLALSQRLPN